MENALIHIYEGEGKGKTTAALGLALRFAGHGGSVLFTQFLKDNMSGELQLLRQIKEIDVFLPQRFFGFTFRMDENQRAEAARYYNQYLRTIIEKADAMKKGLLIMDEIIAADCAGLIAHETLICFLKEKPQQLEIVMTGRFPAEDLRELADYVSRIEKVQHPFDKGITARKGIEK